MSTACHSSNRLYFRKGLKKTPYEILTGNKPNVSYFRVFGCKCLYLIKGVRLSKFQAKALEGIFVGYGAESHTSRVYDKTSRFVIESCKVEFEENIGSQVAQPNVSSEDVEIPQEAIGRMGVGFFRPIEGHLVADREELCSTQVEPSSSQDNQVNGVSNAPNLDQVQDPSIVDQCVSQESSSSSHDASQDLGQDQPSTPHVEVTHVDQGQHFEIGRAHV